MAAPNNVELEAAKFLHKLIQESTDEPVKLATKLHVILQHMKSSGKENSMPYQVISRAMETVINQHGLDIEVLKSSRLPLSGGGTHVGDSSSSQYAGSAQVAGITKDSNTNLAENDMGKIDSQALNRPPVGPSGAGHNVYQGSGSHLSSKSYDHESPSSFDTRSTNSQSQERRDTPTWEKVNQKDSKKASTKRKRVDSSSPSEPHTNNSQQVDTHNLILSRPPGKLSVEGGKHSNSNMFQNSAQMEHIHTVIRAKQESQQSAEKPLDSPNITRLLSQTPNLRYPEEIEVSSSRNTLGLQQGGSLPSTQDILNSRGIWSQNKIGLPFEKSQISRFPSNVGSGSVMTEMLMHQSTGPSFGSGTGSKVHGGIPGISSPMHFNSSSYDNRGLASGKEAIDSENWKHEFVKGTSEKNVEGQFFSANRGEVANTNPSTGKALERDGGISNPMANANKMVQGTIQDNVSEMNMLRNTAPWGTGKSPFSQPHGVSGMPFKEQHLKQLRAQCLVFLAFRNGMMPKKLHLEIALGNFFPKEGGIADVVRKEIVEHKGKEQSVNDPNSISEVTMPLGRLNNARETERTPQGPSYTGILPETNPSSKELENPLIDGTNALPCTRREPELQLPSLDIAESQAFVAKGPPSDSFDDLGNGQQQTVVTNHTSSVMGMTMRPEMINWTGTSSHNEASEGLPPTSAIPHGSAPRDNTGNQSQNLSDSNVPLREHWKSIPRMGGEQQTALPVKGSNGFSTNVTEVETNQEEDDTSVSTNMPPYPKYTTSEKWIGDQQKRRLHSEQNWELKQRKTEQRIAACSNKLKETVSSSEDISAKTKSVIELKKLQLLELQRRLRRDILNDFFKPVTSELDRLKSIKKHRIGRRSKQLERFEQKMKEERQKRIRERQKEFFSEIEVHKEKLDDIFKTKRERWRGFNKYVREFHKRKERIHREKIDRIQREKINLLKINDVEGYLRMVQDAKSDRVKQLLKETEKYLQKLGSKLQEAKTVSRHFESGTDENRTASIVEKNEIAIENEDETDQAKHYLESNEKYYLMAHSIKESIMEQPTSVKGGKLREYQMNGLRWLVSLYNNHLNGILADEMGLGKTVQVIALLCYLIETKNDRGPFLVVVPSSVLPGWESELSLWAPSVLKIIYAGPPEERRRLFKERIVHQKFNVLLTTYEYLMNKHDRPKLSKVDWHYIIIDEGHRIKNASCKLNADLKLYRSSHRLLLTGTPLQNNLEELWALLNFLLPNIFNSSEDFSQWFNKPFQGNADSSAEEALLSEEENLLIINRLHQVLRPFVLRRLKHKVENELPEKIERLVRCEASAYQKLLMKRVEENLGAIGTSKARSVHNSVMELRNICNHPYLSQLHVEEVHTFIPKHYLPNMVRICGKLEMLDRLLPKLKATDHRVLLFSTMTRLLDVMEDYLYWKQYSYLRLDGHTSGGDRGALIDNFNKPGSPYFIFLLSIRAGGVGVNLQAADTVIIFDTDWNPQVDLQAQARAHRIGQKKDVLVLRLETVRTVEEQVRASAEHKLGVANQSITAGFFDNNTSAEDRREYLESLLRECKKEEAAPVLDDDALNDLIARRESEIDVFESIDKQRREAEMATWKKLTSEEGTDASEPVLPLPSRLLTDDDLKLFYEAMNLSDVSNSNSGVVSNVGVKRKSEYLGGLDTQHYGRGKRAREVRSYEEQWTEEEFENLCKAESPGSPKLKEEEVTEKPLAVPMVATEKDLPVPMVATEKDLPVPMVATEKALSVPMVATESIVVIPKTEPSAPSTLAPQPFVDPQPQQSMEVITPPSKRGRGRPKRVRMEISPSPVVLPEPSGAGGKIDLGPQKGTVSLSMVDPGYDSLPASTPVKASVGTIQQFGVWIAPNTQPTISSAAPGFESTVPLRSITMQIKGQNRKTQTGSEPPRRRGKKQVPVPVPIPVLSATSGISTSDTGSTVPVPVPVPVPVLSAPSGISKSDTGSGPDSVPVSVTVEGASHEQGSQIQPAVSLLPAPSGISNFPATSGINKSDTGSGPDSVSESATAEGVSHEQGGPVQPAVSLLPPPSGTSNLDMGLQRGPVSLLSVGPGPESLSCTSVVTGISETVHDLGSGIAPSHSVAKPGRGRGRKAQTGVVEAPRRRGRTRALASPDVPIGSAIHDLKLNEPPQKRTRVSGGRKVNAMRSEPTQTQVQEQTSVTQLLEHKVCTAVQGSKSTDQSDYSAKEKEQTQTRSMTTNEVEAPLSCRVTTVGRTRITDVQNVVEDAPSLPGSSETVVEAAHDQNMDKRTLVLSNLVAVAPACDLPNERCENQSAKEGDAKVKEDKSAVMDKALVSKLKPCEPKSKISAGSIDNTGISRQLTEDSPLVGRNTEAIEPSETCSFRTKTVESFARNVGDSQTLPSSSKINVEATENQRVNTAVQDSKSTKESILLFNTADQNFDKMTLVLSTSVTGDPICDLPIQKCENESAKGGDAEAKNEKENLVMDGTKESNPNLCELESKIFIGSIDNVGFSKQLNKDSPLVSANVEVSTDVPLVIEVSGTCLSESKTVESMVSDGGDSLNLPRSSMIIGDVIENQIVNTVVQDSKSSQHSDYSAPIFPEPSETLVDVTCDQNLDKMTLVLSASVTGNPVCNLSIQTRENESAKGSDVEAGDEKENPVMDDTKASNPNLCDPESKISIGSIDNVGFSRQLNADSPLVSDNVEVSTGVPLIQDSKSTQQSDYSAQIRDQTSPLTTKDGSPDCPENKSASLDGVLPTVAEVSKSYEESAIGQTHVADVEDDVPMINESQSETLLPDLKIDDSIQSVCGDAPCEAVVELGHDLNFEKNTSLVLSTSMTVNPVCDLPVGKCEDQSAKEGGEKSHEESSALDLKPERCEPESKTVDGEVSESQRIHTAVQDSKLTEQSDLSAQNKVQSIS